MGVVAMADEHVPGWGVALQRDVVNLQADVVEIKGENTKAHDGFSARLMDFDRALSARLPVWATFLIGGLMSAVTGLAVAFLRG